MGRSNKKDSNKREAVDYPIDDIERLGRLIDEVERQERMSRERPNNALPSKARSKRKLPPNFVSAKGSVGASPMPLKQTGRVAVVKSSIPDHPVRQTQRSTEKE